MVQLERADRYLFSQLSHDTRKGVRGIAATGLPLDAFVDKQLATVKFNMLLCPLARGGASADSSSGSATDDRRQPNTDREAKQQKHIESLKGQVENMKRKQQQQPSQSSRPNKSAKKGKNKGQQSSGPMPKELFGHLSSTAKGQICFAANTRAGCPHAALAGTCRRGWHICCHKSCNDRESHLFPQCPQH